MLFSLDAKNIDSVSSIETAACKQQRQEASPDAVWMSLAVRYDTDADFFCIMSCNCCPTAFFTQAFN